MTTRPQSEPIRMSATLEDLLAMLPDDLRPIAKRYAEAHPGRVNWCARCASTRETQRRIKNGEPARPRVAQPDGSLCVTCARVEFNERLQRKLDGVSLANAGDKEEQLEAMRAIAVREKRRADAGGKGASEYPFSASEIFEHPGSKSFRGNRKPADGETDDGFEQHAFGELLAGGAKR